MTRRRIDITNIVEVLMSDNIHRTAATVSEGQIVELEITDMTDDGKGLGRLSGLAVFVMGAVPGDKVSARITGLKKRYAIAETVDLLEPSAARVQTPCPYYKECGGCSMLELTYEEQLRIKRRNIITKLERIGALENPTVRDVIGAYAASESNIAGANAVLERRKSALSSRNSELTPESAYADSEFRNVESNSENSEAEAADTEITSRSSESNIRGSDIGTTDQGSELENQGFKSENQDSESNIAGAADAMGAESGTSFESAAHEPMFRYRNKAEFAVAIMGSGPLVGFNKRGSNKIVDCTDCLLQKRATMAAANAIRKLLRGKLISVYDARHGNGFLRGFTIKVCEGTGEMMLIFTGTSKQLPNAEKVIYTISDAIDAVSTDEEPYFLQSVVVEVNKAKDIRETATAYEVVAGSNTVTDITGGGMKFEISAPAFYQVNTKQMIKLYAKVREYACLKGGETVFDLYCGIGTIGLSMASEAGMIIGIESVKNAVIDANRNAVINGIVNVRYYAGRAEQMMPRLLDKEDKLFVDYIDETAPKIAILDPPRAGCDEALLRAAASCDVDKIVYVSCDPGTLARDVKVLGELGYEFIEATPVDMFVATMHVETVALLSKLDVDKHIDVEIKLDELDLTSAESKATYAQIKEYILEKFDLKVSTLYIAQIKKKCGIVLREHYNKSKKEKQVIPQCTPEKEEAIMDALRHFKMI